jgi:hypothetical protein
VRLPAVRLPAGLARRAFTQRLFPLRYALN